MKEKIENTVGLTLWTFWIILSVTITILVFLTHTLHWFTLTIIGVAIFSLNEAYPFYRIIETVQQKDVKR